MVFVMSLSRKQKKVVPWFKDYLDKQKK